MGTSSPPATLLFLLVLAVTVFAETIPSFPCDPSKGMASFSFCNTSLSLDQRATDIVNRLTLSEKISLLVNGAAAIPRLGIPAYEWWSEALHGVSRHGHGTRFNGSIRAATMFPQVIHSVASFNASLWFSLAQAISTEARAMYNQKQTGLTFWAPNINIFRDPRWGRGQETAGEDPLVVAQYAVAYVQGLQDISASGRLKLAACCKHFTAHDLDNWRGVNRYIFNAQVSIQDLRDSFNAPFERCVSEGKAASVMCSYNQVNGVPTCANGAFLRDLVRGKWRLDGYIVSDCDAVDVFFRRQNFTRTAEDAAAAALNAGLDLNCGRFLATHTESAVQSGKVSEPTVSQAVVNNMKVLVRLGWFDGDPASQPYGSLGPRDVCTPEHRDLALQAARQGMVLLHNPQKLLPFSADTVRRVAVVGPNANATEAMLGNYEGVPCGNITVLQGLSAYATTVYAAGCENVLCTSDLSIPAAVRTAQSADATVIVVGGDRTVEAEKLDRMTLRLPGFQEKLVSTVAKAAKGPVALVLMCGGPVDISFALNDSKISAIFWAGYPGQSGGQAIADTIFGAHNPDGRLPVSWYPEEYTATAMTDMRMRPDEASGYPGRTYRFFSGNSLFEFGYGLSYSRFSYSLVSVSVLGTDARCVRSTAGVCSAVTVKNAERCRDATIETILEVKNVEQRDGGETVLLFWKPPSASAVKGTPKKQLVGFGKVYLGRGESCRVNISVEVCRGLAVVDGDGEYRILEGRHTLVAGDVAHAIDFVTS